MWKQQELRLAPRSRGFHLITRDIVEGMPWLREGQLALGTWQGIWLGEHREHGGPRQLIATLQGVN